MNKDIKRTFVLTVETVDSGTLTTEFRARGREFFKYQVQCALNSVLDNEPIKSLSQITTITIKAKE